MDNPCENSNMLSLYPIPIIVALIYLWNMRKNEEFKKHLDFLIPLLLVTLLLSIWTFFVNNKLLVNGSKYFTNPKVDLSKASSTAC